MIEMLMLSVFAILSTTTVTNGFIWTPVCRSLTWISRKTQSRHSEDCLKMTFPRIENPAANVNRENDPDFMILLESFLAGSYFMYAFTSLRQAILANDILPDHDPHRHDIERTELILTQSSAVFREKNLNIHRHLQNEVTGDAIRLFSDLNKDFIRSIPNDAVNTVKGAVDNFFDVLNKLQPLNFEIHEFDDEFSNKELVYSITVNRTNKRITVFFRGSVVNSRDWPTNFNAFFKTIPPPTMIAHEFNDTINVHRGFYSYLNERLDRATSLPLPTIRKLRDFVSPEDPSEITTKIAEIISNLEAILSQDEFKDYKVYCTGHSLGGALAQLLSFQLAGEGTLSTFQNACPVTAITYASPNVGDDGFRRAYQKLEKKGLVRHIRVSNAGDIVPVSPPGFGYTQTGVNIYVSEDSDGMETGYRNIKTFGQTLSFAFKHRIGLLNLADDIAKHHGLTEYYTNLVTAENQLLDDSVEELYDKYAGNFTE